MQLDKLDNIWKNPDGTFKKGHPGIGGRPKGKTLKEFAREYLESLPDEEKTQYLASLPAELVWRMAEGQPKQDTEVSNPDGNLKTIIINKYASNSQPTPETN